MKKVQVGGCLCGQVRYELEGAPKHVFYCHCTDCQKETGGPFSTELYVRAEQIKLSGGMKTFVVTGDSGKNVVRNFCSKCSSVVMTEFEVDPESVCIKACSLDDPSWLKPEFHLYVKSKQSWFEIFDDLPRYDGDIDW